MRRTASLDAIYLKGQWPRGTVGYGSYLLDKATQTPEEWMIDIKRYTILCQPWMQNEIIVSY